MSTRSTIAVELADGTVSSVYCHWDGYLEGVGQTLVDYYSDRDLAVQLVHGGSISSLGINIHETDYYPDCESWVERWRNMDDYVQNMREYAQEYNYLLDSTGQWTVTQGDRLHMRANVAESLARLAV